MKLGGPPPVKAKRGLRNCVRVCNRVLEVAQDGTAHAVKEVADGSDRSADDVTRLGRRRKGMRKEKNKNKQDPVNYPGPKKLTAPTISPTA